MVRLQLEGRSDLNSIGCAAWNGPLTEIVRRTFGVGFQKGQ
jgi:hypothetical protein